MVHGRICSCCGEKRTVLDRDESANTNQVFWCQPCAEDGDGDAPPPPLDMSIYTIPTTTTVVVLDATQAFEGLTLTEKHYALELSRADWAGSKICLLQCSPESPLIFSLLQFVFSNTEDIALMAARAKDAGFTEEEVKEAMMYCAAFYGNLGNYKSFGDTKFVPVLSPAWFRLFLVSGLPSTNTQTSKLQTFDELWDGCVDRMYSLPPRHRQLGLGSKGISTYFSSNCGPDDADIAARFLTSIQLSPYNTRLFKSNTSPNTYTIRIASAVEGNHETDAVYPFDDIEKGGESEHYTFNSNTAITSNCGPDDADIAARFLTSIQLSPYNTRLFKTSPNTYTIRIASAVEGNQETDAVYPFDDIEKGGESEHYTFTLQHGDYAPLMTRINTHLQAALPHAANPHQTSMLTSYIQSFSSGSINDHKTASTHWIRDTGPAVESYIGFIESYRDPSGARAEWEGFVAIVNRDVSRKFGALVENAESMLELLPWPVEFEKDIFLRPDFTSLEVLAFGSSGVPAGINIPNYDDLRQDVGFKNVSLGNVLSASYGSGEKPVTFVAHDDQVLFKKFKGDSFEVQVGIHELLGHGSGKLYHKDTTETQSLLDSKLLHPLTQQPITGPFYQPGSTWDTTFGKLASSYEECRAECCGLYLCLEQRVLSVFGHEPQTHASSSVSSSSSSTSTTPDDIHDVSYINWLLMVRAGLVGLEFYSPETGEWRQAHMWARYVILQVLLEAGEGLVTLTTTTGDDGEPDVVCTIDRAKIATVGKTAIGQFLRALQVHKSLGDVEAGTKLFQRYSIVTPAMSAARAIVMARKEARKLMVQPHLEEGPDGTPVIRSFPGTPAGLIESFVARFPAEDAELLALAEKDMVHVLD
eukprot:CAMPEP_0194395418 /NCGR_PEP_ID=MMETSP0174-20130528/124414_1 /TAXON_ID=216777 /ORGANISM="Proboscia alata, Strain PI-D3" /LENGTH=868 /DNA_ID=CAMNT_0039191355 /DNA_START=112 /DNA_END=2719 /DNA_ORIENTATION=+